MRKDMETLGLARDTLNPLSMFLDMVSPFKYMFYEGDGGDGGGSGDGSGGSVVTTAGDGSGGEWYSGFSEDVKNHPTTQRYKNSEEAMKGLINIEKKIGAKRVVVPTDKSSTEEIAEFHRDIGVPEDSGAYEIYKPEGEVDERLKVTPESETSFRDLAKAANLTSTQAKVIQEKYHEMQVNNLKMYDDGLIEEKKNSETLLRKEWGAKYEANLDGANKVAKSMGGDEFFQWLTKGEGNNPIVIKALSNMASKIGEDTFGEAGKAGLTLTPAEAKVKINEIRDNPKSAYNDGTHRLHKEAVEEMKSLYTLAHPEEKKE